MFNIKMQLDNINIINKNILYHFLVKVNFNRFISCEWNMIDSRKRYLEYFTLNTLIRNLIIILLII